jgi:hypothetical protein
MTAVEVAKAGVRKQDQKMIRNLLALYSVSQSTGNKILTNSSITNGYKRNGAHIRLNGLLCV